MEEYRLSCLKLAHDHTLRPEEVVARAKAYHDFVVGAEGLEEVGRMSPSWADKLLAEYIDKSPSAAAKIFSPGATGADFLAAPIEVQQRVLDAAVPPELSHPAAHAPARKTLRDAMRHIHRLVLALLQDAVPTLREPDPTRPPRHRGCGHD